MVVDRAAGTIAHRRFREIAGLIPANDLLVLNTTRVFRARLLGKRDSGAPAEIFLLKPLGGDRWEAMVHPGAKLKPGRVVHLAADFDATILESTERGTRVVQLATSGSVAEAIERHGHVPLPPYIERADSDADAERYQTVYASENGSVGVVQRSTTSIVHRLPSESAQFGMEWASPAIELFTSPVCDAVQPTHWGLTPTPKS